MYYQLDKTGQSSKNTLIKESKHYVFSWKEIKEYPFELFKSSALLPGFLFNKQNLDTRLDWASEYEIIYNSQLMET
ncbi:MAG: hypothetical protein ACK4R9_13920 [Ignavibacterium sp.]